MAAITTGGLLGMFLGRGVLGAVIVSRLLGIVNIVVMTRRKCVQTLQGQGQQQRKYCQSE